jgi:hypothetical protein
VAADAEQPPQPPARGYVNFAAGQGSATELAVTLGYREGDANPTMVAPIVMAWEFVPEFIRFLQQQLNTYEEQVGPVRDLKKLAKEGTE